MNRILKKIIKELTKLEDIKAVMVYGSFARGEYTSRSDIDLFILTTSKSTIKKIQEEIIKLENITGRNIQPTVRAMDQLQKTDTGLLQNIFHEGKLLYLREFIELPAAILLEQKPYIIYSFRLNTLPQNEKAKFNNNFYGRVKNKYQYSGFLKEIRGQKLSSGCVIVPYSEKLKIEKFFKKFKIKFKQTDVWK